MKDIKRWLPGALVSILIVVAILYFVNLPKMFAALRSADYRFIAVAVVLGFSWLWVRAIVWRTLLRERASYWDVFNSLNAGYLLNAILPFRLGELGRAYLLSLKTDLKFVEILPTIVIERSIDLAITAVLFLSSLPFVVGAKGADRIAIILGVVVFAGLLFLYILARNDQWALDTFHKISARWPSIQRFGGDILEIIPHRSRRVDRRLALRPFHVLDAIELGYVYRQFLFDRSRFLSAGAMDMGHVWTRCRRIWQRGPFIAWRSRDL